MSGDRSTHSIEAFHTARFEVGQSRLQPLGFGKLGGRLASARHLLRLVVERLLEFAVVGVHRSRGNRGCVDGFGLGDDPGGRCVSGGSQLAGRSDSSGMAVAASSWLSSSLAPPRLTATVLTTGIPSSCCNAATSMVIPRLMARSVMFSASIIGSPRRLTSSTRRRLSLRLVAVSYTHLTLPTSDLV